MSLLRTSLASLAVAAVLLGGACSDSDEPTPNSEQHSDQGRSSTSTSGVAPPGNPEGGETGTNGTNTGGG